MININKGTLTVIKTFGRSGYWVECTCGHIFKRYKCRFESMSGRGCPSCKAWYKGSENGNYRHGGNTINKPEYNSWRAMRERCQNPNYHHFHIYGGRGVKVCDRWNNPKTGLIDFIEDMGKKPTPKHSIDRIDRDGNYEPSNCRWATQREQTSHTSMTRLETIDGITKTASEWCRQYNKILSTVNNRMGLGWSFEEAIKTPMAPLGTNQSSGIERVIF